MFESFISFALGLIISFGGVWFPPVQSGTLRSVDVQVVGVIDGDTIEVEIDGKKEKVRYIGIDTPEPYRDGEPACFSHEATERNRELVEGSEVRLVPDREDKDKYGRLLRYVYVGEVFVNRKLIEGGFAKTLRIKPNTTHADEFTELEKEAKESEEGLWGACSEATTAR